MSRQHGSRRRAARHGTPERVIPQRVEELTADWFTDVLATGSTVTEVRCEEIGVGIGFMGQVHRCHLSWRPTASIGDSADLPSSVIVKTPTQVPENFAAGDALRAYEREIVVYQTLRTTLGVPMPGYHHGEMDPDPAPWIQRPLFFLFDHLSIRGVNWVINRFLGMSGKSRRRYILVIEDISDARPPTQMSGGSLDDARRSLEVLARFHAANWMRTDATQHYRHIFPVDTVPRVGQASYVRNREAFVERFGSVLHDGMLERLDEIQTRVPEICSSLAAEPWTLLHGDYRLDNVLFRPNGEVVVLDFQGLSSGRPAIDVAYFITTALSADHRDEEETLLRAYHEALVASGVSSYSFDELVRDGELAKELLAHRIVGSADVLDTSVATGGDDFLDVIQLRVLDWLR
ncbi:MAG: phosphotransferase [Ilumatobacter sp.]|uniref:phosphotransferase n=1 Tax=Ilumatobacter sp. TaxID=1967498 RepID=UPI00391B370E